MDRALVEARAAAERGEVPIGCVILAPDGTVLAQAGNRTEADRDPTAHAEMQAIRQSGQVLQNYRMLDCTLYVTLEPCAMCAGALVHSRVQRLVFGATDLKAGAEGRVAPHPAMLARSIGEGEGLRSLLMKPRSKAFSKLARIWLAATPISGWLGDSTVAVPTMMHPGRFGGLV